MMIVNNLMINMRNNLMLTVNNQMINKNIVRSCKYNRVGSCKDLDMQMFGFKSRVFHFSIFNIMSLTI